MKYNHITPIFEGLEDYMEGVTKEDLELNDSIVDIAIKLREMRESAGLTQKEAASLYGCTVQMISKLESGDYNPTITTLWKYARKLGYRLSVRFVSNDDANAG